MPRKSTETPFRELPRAKRYDLFPVLEDQELFSIPDELKRRVAAGGWTDEMIRNVAIVEFTGTAEIGKTEVNQSLQDAADAYLRMAKIRRDLRARVATLEAAITAEKRTGVPGFTGLFQERGADSEIELRVLREEMRSAEKYFDEFRNRVRAVYQQRFKKDSMPDAPAWARPDFNERTTLFALARRGDARRKYAAYRLESEELSEREKKLAVYADLLRVRQSAEDYAAAAARQSKSRANPEEFLETEFSADVDAIAEKIITFKLLKQPAGMKEDEFRAAVARHLRAAELRMPAESLRSELHEKIRELAERRRGISVMLSNARNSELAELVRHEEVAALLRSYHVDKKRFLPVGEIKEEFEELEQIVTSPRGPILRALLYGPPGTGKTESLREIAARRGQNVRVVSLHESSSFETLVGMHQIPIPKGSSLADAERFWKGIVEEDPEVVAAHLPAGVLHEFAGATPAAKGDDFKKWFKTKLGAARAIAALGAVAPDDPRVRRAEQAALAAWLDQPITEGLIAGDLVILDEADRAGNALEGLQDLLTRRPGDSFQPPGRPEPFRIHKNARVAMTANWGDLQTEFTAGGGKLSAPIISRTVERRKVDYLKPGTELQLFAIMTSTPEGVSLLTSIEEDMANTIISTVFPRLRELYLKPGELQFISPISVRTLENIARRMIDETTRTRLRGADGQLITVLEAAWQELAGGPWREDQKDRICQEIMRIMAASGLFNLIPGNEAQYLVVSKITGLPKKVVAPIVGAQVRLDQVEQQSLPAGYSFGALVSAYGPAENKALYPALTFPSPVAAAREAERMRRKQIEERGANPETQERFEHAVREWLSLLRTFETEGVTDDEIKLSREVSLLEQLLRGVPIGRGDLDMLLERIREDSAFAPEIDRRVGLLVSLAINRHLQTLPSDVLRKDFRYTIGENGPARLDLLGFRLPAGELAVLTDAGDDLGRELSGGNIVAERAANRCGNRMRSGRMDISFAASRAGQGMEGGLLNVMRASDRLGINAKGGRITVDYAGDRVGTRSKAKITIRSGAGERIGQELDAEGSIELDASAGYGSLGSSIKGTIKRIGGGHLIVDQGVVIKRVA